MNRAIVFIAGERPLRTLARISALLGCFALLMAAGCCATLDMPGSSYSGPMPELTEEQKALAKELKEDVSALADMGTRNFEHQEKMRGAAERIEKEMERCGLAVSRVDYQARPAILSVIRGAKIKDKQVFSNIVGEIKGSGLPDEVIVVGAHYDSAPIGVCPGADDNASGVAATLALARKFAQSPSKRTLRFIAFANEEPPFFWTDDMGSRICAMKSAKAKEKIVAMITPECVGYYSGKPGSQSYPFPLNKIYPDRGDFIAFIGDSSSNALVKECVGKFRESAKFPSEGAALPFIVPGVGWSDHWSYTKEGYPSLMVTDTAPFRNPFYHTSNDTPDKLDFDRMALVVEGLGKVVEHLAAK